MNVSKRVRMDWNIGLEIEIQQSITEKIVNYDLSTHLKKVIDDSES